MTNTPDIIISLVFATIIIGLAGAGIYFILKHTKEEKKSLLEVLSEEKNKILEKASEEKKALLDENSRLVKAIIAKNANEYVMTASIDKVAPEPQAPTSPEYTPTEALSDDEFDDMIKKQVTSPTAPAIAEDAQESETTSEE